MRRIHHLSLNIDGCLRNAGKKKLTGLLSDDNDNPMSDKEVRAYLAEQKALGHKLIPSTSECIGFDPFGGGCPGHEVKETNP